MNDLIAELAEQCHHRYSEHHINLEKFSELIVRECINQMEISKKCDPYTGQVFDIEYNTTINDQIEMLKEHFGVKQ